MTDPQKVEQSMPLKPEMLSRPTVSGLDSILGLPFKLLDEGFVRVVDYMGDDAAIVQAARVSYGKGTKQIHEDRGLIRYLMRHMHSTPFEMCEIKFHVRVPMDTWRQWIRHRTANVNEYSTRYSLAIDAAQHTAPNAWREQSTRSRQGSDGNIPTSVGTRLSAEEADFLQQARTLYDARITEGVAREQARKDLPLSTYTEAYWKIDLHNLLHFLLLRMDEHAQTEIREYARVIGQEIVAKWVPHTWEAFRDYRQSAMQLSGIEKEILQVLIIGQPEMAQALAEKHGLLKRQNEGLVPNRERSELEVKLQALGINPPWNAM